MQPDELCDYLQVTRRTLARYESQGLFKPAKLSKRNTIFFLEDVIEVLKSLQSNTTLETK